MNNLKEMEHEVPRGQVSRFTRTALAEENSDSGAQR